MLEICMSVSMSGCGNGAMVEPLRHRQTKGAATDMFYLTLPRHISTLPRFAVGMLIAEHPPHRSGRARFEHPACMGLSLSRGRHAILVVLCIPFFCSTRAASILPYRPHIS